MEGSSDTTKTGRLCLSRNVGTLLLLDFNGEIITISFDDIRGRRCDLSIVAPKSVKIIRKDPYETKRV